ncbi:MAG: RDD family protein [Labilithrix sp.]|nr:RDD family protein [Labilithrix sp.]MBX3221244.1 RDD family protein [Labilithrix sp.]
MSPLDTDVAIETPEHIVFHYRVAGPARRALGHVLDLALCYGAVVVLGVIVVLAALGGGIDSGEIGSAAKAGFGLVLLALFAAQWIYFVVWEAVFGRSPGKMAVGLRVVTTSGRPIGWRAAALRNLLRAADLLPVGYLVGVVSMALSSRFQRLGDLVAGTMVVVPENARPARALELSPPAEPRELRELPEHIALDADERAAIELFLRRRHSLGQAREHELAGMIARTLGDRLGYAHRDPSRLLALVYDRAVNAGRLEAPPSSWYPKAKADRSAGAGRP